MAEIDRHLLEKYSSDRALFSAVMFRHRHPQESADFHIEMTDLWRSADELIVLEAFREAAKTTTAEEFLLAEGCYGNFPYALIVGETYSKACQRLEAISKEASSNTKLHSLFGGKVLARKSIENRVWFKSGAMLEAVGWEQELQSFKYLDFRPQLAYLDDVENEERVRDSEAVDKSERKFWLELLPAMDKMCRRIRITQTRRAEDCMVTRFMNNPSFIYRGYPICNGPVDAPTTESLWPARYSMEWIRKERDAYRGAGKLTFFLQAYMLQATNPDAKPFKDEHIRAMDLAPWQWMPKYAIYDPARTANPEKSDQAGKVVVSRFGSKILVHESGGYYWKPDALIKDIFAANEAWEPASIGVEKNSLDEWILQPLRMKMMQKGVALPLKPLQAPQDRNKDTFIMGLQAFFAAGDIVLVGGKVAHPQLTAEILNFPNGTKNILNALAYSLKMFAGQPVYEDFGHANIGEAPECRAGTQVYVGFNGTANETVCVAVVRERRSLIVAADFSAGGAPAEAVKILAADLRAEFPGCRFSIWVPAEIYDQWQRVAVVPSLRAVGLTPFRGEHAAVSRGCLTDKIRTALRNRRMLTVDAKRAHLTANALAAGYAIQVKRGMKTTAEPEQGISRLVAEALECVAGELDRSLGEGTLSGAHMATNAQGMRYASALPQTRR